MKLSDSTFIIIGDTLKDFNRRLITMTVMPLPENLTSMVYP